MIIVVICLCLVIALQAVLADRKDKLHANERELLQERIRIPQVRPIPLGWNDDSEVDYSNLGELALAGQIDPDLPPDRS